MAADVCAELAVALAELESARDELQSLDLAYSMQLEEFGLDGGSPATTSPGVDGSASADGDSVGALRGVLALHVSGTFQGP